MAFVASALSVLLLSIISSTAAKSSPTQHSEVYPRELDYYDPSQFIARTGHSSMVFQLSCTMEHVVDLLVAIVVGNYLYIDGGEVYLNDTGAVAVYPGSRPPLSPVHHILVPLLTRAQRILPTPSI
jgi:hypothetical protein